MRLLFEISMEHKDLPLAEICSCLKSVDIEYDVIDNVSSYVLIDSNVDLRDIINVSSRLSMTHFVDEFLFSCKASIRELEKTVVDFGLNKKGSLAVKYKNRSNNVDSRGIVEVLADFYTKGREVNLNDPDVEIRALITDDNVNVGLKIFEVDRTQFEDRRAHHRPFFSPISLHPKIARVLVNLSEIRPGDVLLDPFCGTGGILLEAGLMNIRIIGSDIEKKMIDGSRKTLEYYKINDYELICSDVGDICKDISDVDAVVTDFPYGKAASTRGENIKDLYNRAFMSISKVLKKGGRAVVGLSDEDIVSIGEKYLSLIDIYSYKVHKSLTRYFAVYKY